MYKLAWLFLLITPFACSQAVGNLDPSAEGKIYMSNEHTTLLFADQLAPALSYRIDKDSLAKLKAAKNSIQELEVQLISAREAEQRVELDIINHYRAANNLAGPPNPICATTLFSEYPNVVRNDTSYTQIYSQEYSDKIVGEYVVFTIDEGKCSLPYFQHISGK